VLSRLDNLLRLVRTNNELEVTRKVVGSTATHDPLTGTHTPHYLVTEGRKHFAHARRHGGELSVMALRLETYDDIALHAGKDIADVVLARIAKLILEKVRAEDSVARVAHATFMVVAAPRDVAVERVVAEVGLAADEPFRERRPGIVEDFGKSLAPMHQLRFFGPEAFAIVERTPVEIAVSRHRFNSRSAPFGLDGFGDLLQAPGELVRRGTEAGDIGALEEAQHALELAGHARRRRLGRRRWRRRRRHGGALQPLQRQAHQVLDRGRWVGGR